MTIWALSDLHLAFGAPSKSMEIFGPEWSQYAEKIKTNWQQLVQKQDLVLIPGDISWAMKFDDALIDLQWIDELPGTKVILKGNHDYWWPSVKVLSSSLPKSIHFIQNNVFNWNGVTIGGARLWDTDEYNFNSVITFQDNPKERTPLQDTKMREKIFCRELERLKLSLKQLNKDATVKIAMTHYPPIGLEMESSRASKLLEEFQIDYCVFGHLHNVQREKPLFGEKKGVRYLFTSCDYLQFIPLKIV